MPAANTSWVPIPTGSDFPLENLPYGVFSRDRASQLPHIGLAVGEQILDLYAVADAGLLDGYCDRALFLGPRLNPFLAAGRPTWLAVRERLTELLRAGGEPALRERNTAAFFAAQSGAWMELPVDVGDYVDFYSSEQHARNLGRIFRPNTEPLLPSWKWIPIGYHGRSSTVVVDGTHVVRPQGQRKAPDAEAPTFGPSKKLDIELEVGFITGPGNALGEPIPIAQAREHIFGVVLVNDWSARDIQAWEYQPLGPFLGKSFATTISPWIVTLEALEPFLVAGPEQVPEPLAYLRSESPSAYDVELTVEIQTMEMRKRGVVAETISHTNARELYWSMEQQLAHATSNGAISRPGDLFASGTISGSEPGSYGSLIELTWNGTKPLTLADGETRTFLEQGDEVTLRGWCERRNLRIGFGTCRGRIQA